jgi:hypothetical protein
MISAKTFFPNKATITGELGLEHIFNPHEHIWVDVLITFDENKIIC